MRVLHVSPAYTPAFKFGGPIQSIHALNKALVRKGVEVHTLTTTAGLEVGSYPDQAGWADVNGVLVKYCKYHGYVNFTFSPMILKELIVSVPHYDLIHISPIWNFPVLAAARTALFYRIPFVISPRGTLYKETIKIKSRAAKLAYYNIIAKHFVQRADALHFTTRDEEEKVTKYLNLKNYRFVVPNGLDLHKFENIQMRSFADYYPVLKGRKYILFLGRISKKKGLDLLTAAFRNLSRMSHDIFLVIAGPENDDYGKKVRTWLRRDGLLKRTIFTGMLTEEVKLVAYRDAELFVLASYSENFGMAVIEAMACGTPVVISDMVGIHKEVAENKAGIVVNADEMSLYRGMLELITQNSLRAEIGKRGKNMVATYYDIERSAETMINEYEKVLDSNRARSW